MAAYHPIDVHVGLRLRQRRTLLGMSQTAMGKALGVSFQQVQKFEKGANRVSCSQLFELSHILNVSVDFFFAEMPRSAQTPTRQDRIDRLFEPTRNTDNMVKRETLQLVRAFYKIRRDDIRRHILATIKSLSRNSDKPRT